MKDWVEGAIAVFCVLGALVMMRSCSSKMDRWVANEYCQRLNYSAGHYEKKAGLVCEQWIEAAKVTPPRRAVAASATSEQSGDDRRER